MICSYCKREMHNRRLDFDGLLKTRDHYIPQSRGGSNDKSNIRFACRCCNGIKGDMMPDQWEAFMAANPCWWAKQANVKLTKPRPKFRPLRPDEAIPVEFADPSQQAAFEIYATKYRNVLRVPNDF